jgi:predicted DNA binding CopG/RHH family protein
MASNKNKVVPVEKEDSTAHLDLSQARRVSLPNLKFSTESISLRLPSALLREIKTEANRRDVPYQSFIKLVLAERFLKTH